ncbi:hypothetical protein ISTM_196 [Insectomime virus]|uniref:Uncharacterized protein n=1 Tax=Tunisvirus fontaine2 TaxID=1421067 RepID=V9SEV4_9VIRU|nr:hypothetical protein D1R32_gp124 [Tunisvirus fontaine2]AHA46094.1 hypothetical protein ISTM_196 [Insectomime virus]AHC54841.1 hypothetical protein TNS_ORF123 [Tunisvirus fontaine2]
MSITHSSGIASFRATPSTNDKVQLSFIESALKELRLFVDEQKKIQEETGKRISRLELDVSDIKKKTQTLLSSSLSLKNSVDSLSKEVSSVSDEIEENKKALEERIFELEKKSLEEKPKAVRASRKKD